MKILETLRVITNLFDVSINFLSVSVIKVAKRVYTKRSDDRRFFLFKDNKPT